MKRPDWDCLRIRESRIEDLPALLSIYNDEIQNGVATLDLTPKGMEEWTVWYHDHSRERDKHNPHWLLTADLGGEAIGYASLSSYRQKEAYRSTAELSIYVHREHRRKGIAMALLKEILALAKTDGQIHTVVSVITAGNEASRRLHEAFGFVYCGRIPEVGMKFGKLLDIENYAKIL